jgi:hypothetical protein
VTLMVRDIYIDCTNSECGHRWKAKLEFEHSIAVPLHEKIKAYLPTRASKQRRQLMLTDPPPARVKADPFPKPDWADAAVWADFLKNRKAKRKPNTDCTSLSVHGRPVCAGIFMPGAADRLSKQWTALSQPSPANGWISRRAARKKSHDRQ